MIPQGGQRFHTVLQGIQTLNTVLEAIYSAQCKCLTIVYTLKVSQEGIYVKSIKDVVMNVAMRGEGCCYSTV